MPHLPSPLHLAVALDGAGWHPSAWREPDARPKELFTAQYWVDQVTEAQRGLLDFVTIEDSLGPRSTNPSGPDHRVDQVQGRLDAVLVAARVAPLTQGIGLIPTVVVTHTEPFHASKAIATLDYVSLGRAGVQVRVSARPDHAAHFGRREFPPYRPDDPSPNNQAFLTELFDEAGDYVEVLRRLWDSWEDDAEIRDTATGRFIDRDKLHYINFVGRYFSVRGPSITPRPPQGQPIVATLARRTHSYQLAARSTDIAFITPRDAEHSQAIVAEIRAERAGHTEEPVRIFADLAICLDQTASRAEARKARLDELAGAPFTSEARVFTGTPAQLADLLEDWAQTGLSGFRLRPFVIEHDLKQITRALVPELQRRGVFRASYEATTLRGLLGMSRPPNRYAA